MTSAAHPGEINVKWAKAYNAGDVDAMLELYEPGAVIVPGPGADPLTGMAAFGPALRQFAGMGAGLTFQPRYWLVRDDLALGSIDFTLTLGDGGGMNGRTAEVARRQADGSWKYVLDHPFSG
jgi:ketosteroid isomerase-like protein